MILETKLLLPQPKPGTLLRTGLLTLIGNNLDKKLILICASAGYGKTTLLGQLIKEARLPCLFYDLDKSDSDLLVFYSYLVNGIKQIDPALVKYSQKLLKQGSETGKNFELLFGTLINELFEKRKEELFVILDNYHNLAEDSIVHRAMDFFIDRLPEKVRVVISSRSAPPMPSLARWRAKQDMFDVSREDLAFTGEDIAALLKDVYKTALSEEDLRQVAARTEGWITGIRLVIQSAEKDKITISESLQKQAEASQPLYEYFANEILSGESEAMQNFLTKSSILETMTPWACDAILETVNSVQVLKRMEKRLLFISKTGPDEYKYHHLFKEFLLGRLNDEGTVLHRKAADYYKKNGSTEQAIEHYLEAKDCVKAGELICSITDDLIDKARFTVIENWLQRIPEKAFAKKPELHIVASIFYSAQGRLDEALAHCDRALPLLKQKGDFSAIAEVLKEQARIAGMKNDHDRALKLTRQALAILGRVKKQKEEVKSLTGTLLNIMAGAWLELGNYNKAVSCMLRARRITEYDYIDESNLALIYTYKRDERLAFEVYRDLMNKMKGVYFYKIGGIYYNAVIFALHRGNVDWAEQTTEQGWILCQPYDDSWSKAHLHYCFGIVNLQKEQWEDALSRFHQAENLASDLKLVILKFAAQRDTIRAYRYQGNYSAGGEYLGRMLQAISAKSSRPLANLKIEQSLLESAHGRNQEAEAIANRCLAEARRRGWKMIAFLSMLAAAQIAAERKDDKLAISLLRRAVRLAKLKGYDGILMRELRASPKLIGLTKKLKVESDYLGRIIAECKKYGTVTGESTFAKASADKPSLTVQLLGGFELADGGVAGKIQLKRKTTRAILAFFLLHPEKGFSWEEIAAWAWPDSSAEAAHQMFKNNLCLMHRAAPILKSAIVYQDRRYSLNPGTSIRVDAREFREILKQASQTSDEAEKVRLLEKAASLYQGPLLPGYYYLWADDLRNAFEGEYLHVLSFLAKKCFGGQNYEKSAEFCLAYLKTDSLDEDIHRLLLADYIRQGLKAKAIKHYAYLKKILRKHLNAEPSEETSGLIKTIL